MKYYSVIFRKYNPFAMLKYDRQIVTK